MSVVVQHIIIICRGRVQVPLHTRGFVVTGRLFGTVPRNQHVLGLELGRGREKVGSGWEVGEGDRWGKEGKGDRWGKEGEGDKWGKEGEGDRWGKVGEGLELG